MAQRMGVADWFMLAALSLVWGGSFFFFELALRELPPFTIVLGRVGIAAGVLLAIVRASGRRMPVDRRSLGGFLILGAISNAIPFSLIVWGQTQIASGLASIFNAMTPIFTVIVAHLFFSDRMTPSRIIAAILGFTGVAVLIGPDIIEKLDPYNLGQLAVLGAACSYGFATNYGKRFGGNTPIVNATGMLCGATVILLPVTLVVDQPWTLSPGPLGWATLLGLSLLCTAFAYLLYFRLLASAGPTNLSLVTFLVPASAIGLGTLFLGESLAPTAFAGLALIFAGLAIMDGRLLGWLATRVASRQPGNG